MGDDVKDRLCAEINERLKAIHAEFGRHECRLTLQASMRGASVGGWFARYQRSERDGLDGLAHGDTELEAAELALAKFRNRRTGRPS
jgi:hypothetical protein